MTTFYDPSVGAAAEHPQAARLPGLSGTVVGLYDNTKEQADIILAALGAELRSRCGVKELVSFRGIHYSRPAPPATIEDMARRCDAVVCALGG